MTVPLSVLIVDDELAIRLLCRVNLTADGMAVREAGDGDSALAAMHDAQPDVVLLDVMLPGDDGFAIAARIREDPLIAKTPIIFLTARADIEDRDRERRVGAAGHITKPFNPIDLARAVRAILKSTRLPS